MTAQARPMSLQGPDVRRWRGGRGADVQDAVEARPLSAQVAGALGQEPRHADARTGFPAPDAETVPAVWWAKLLALAVARKEAVDDRHAGGAAHGPHNGEAGGVEAGVVGEVDEEIGGKASGTIGGGGAVWVVAGLVGGVH